MRKTLNSTGRKHTVQLENCPRIGGDASSQKMHERRPAWDLVFAALSQRASPPCGRPCGDQGAGLGTVWDRRSARGLVTGRGAETSAHSAAEGGGGPARPAASAGSVQQTRTVSGGRLRHADAPRS